MDTPDSYLHHNVLKVVLVTAISQTACSWTLTPLPSFQISPQKPEETANDDEIVRAKISYLTEIKENKFPVVLNMRNIFQDFLGNELWPLIVFDNFQKINLEPINYPTVLRTPVPLVLEEVTEEEIVSTIIMGSSTLLYDNISSSDNTSDSSCPISKFIVNYTDKRDSCLRINLATLALKMRPFSFTVHIGVYPPVYMVEFETEWIYPQLFMPPEETFRTYVTKPSYMVPVNGMVLLQGQQESMYNRADTAVRWVDELQHTPESSYVHDTFLIFSGKTIANMYRFEKVGVIQHIYVLQICPDCASQVTNGYGSTLPIELESFDYKQVQSLAFNKVDMNPVWLIGGSDYSLDHVMAKAFRFCEWRLVDGKFWKKYLEPNTLSSSEWVALAHSHVWNSMMKNFSLFYAAENDELVDTKFLITLGHLAYVSSLFTFPHYVSNHTNTLRIVGCGKRADTSLPFQELFNVFEKYVWLAILVLIATFPLATKVLIKESFNLNNFTAVIKVFLEQSDPFQNSVVNGKPNRIMIGLFLLMGIILSNACKNTNVYNMVVPREPILYKYFEDLVRDDFRICTRSIAAKAEVSEECENYVLYPLGRCLVNIEGNAIALVTELEALVYDYK